MKINPRTPPHVSATKLPPHPLARIMSNPRRLTVFMLYLLVAILALALARPAHASPADDMIKAVKFNDVNAVKKLLAKGVDPNLKDDTGIPLIVLGAREKSNEVVELLGADSRTNLEQPDSAGENALMLAALNNDLLLAQWLVAKGAEVNKTGWTPLHYAATSGNDALVKMLIEASAYIDAGSPNGTTPLMMAARGGHITTVKLLLDEGADLRVKNQLGLTAIDFAVKYHQKDIADGLTERLNSMDRRPSPKPATAADAPASGG
jgi:ankyrin repeat protein